MSPASPDINRMINQDIKDKDIPQTEGSLVTNDVTLKNLFITNPYHNTRVVPGDKMVIIGEIFDVDLQEKIDEKLGETNNMLNRDFKTEFMQVDKKAGLRIFCLSNIKKRLGGIDRDAFDAKIRRKNVKIKKTQNIINRMKRLGRRKRRMEIAKREAAKKKEEQDRWLQNNPDIDNPRINSPAISGLHTPDNSQVANSQVVRNSINLKTPLPVVVEHSMQNLEKENTMNNLNQLMDNDNLVNVLQDNPYDENDSKIQKSADNTIEDTNTLEEGSKQGIVKDLSINITQNHSDNSKIVNIVSGGGTARVVKKNTQSEQ